MQNKLENEKLSLCERCKDEEVYAENEKYCNECWYLINFESEEEETAPCMNCGATHKARDIEYRSDEEWRCPDCKEKKYCSFCQKDMDTDEDGNCIFCKLTL